MPITFDGSTLKFQNEFGPVSATTQDVYDAAGGNAGYDAALTTIGTDELVKIVEGGGKDAIVLSDSLIESSPGVQGASYLVYTGNGQDEVTGSSYGDKIYGEGGRDDLSGMDGNDYIYGGNAKDIINGNVGNDFVYGEAGNDEVRGGKGHDVVSGGDGRDDVYGDKGKDTINGDAGNDRYFGGGGADTFVFDGSISQEDGEFDRIMDMRSNDQIDLTGLKDLTSLTVLKLGGNVRLIAENAAEDQHVIQAITKPGVQDLLLQEGSYGLGSLDTVRVDTNKVMVTIDVDITS